MISTAGMYAIPLLNFRHHSIGFCVESIGVYSPRFRTRGGTSTPGIINIPGTCIIRWSNRALRTSQQQSWTSSYGGTQLHVDLEGTIERKSTHSCTLCQVQPRPLGVLWYSIPAKSCKYWHLDISSAAGS